MRLLSLELIPHCCEYLCNKKYATFVKDHVFLQLLLALRLWLQSFAI